MSKYRKTDATNLEQNFYIAFVENLNRQTMSEIIRAGLIPPEDVKCISALVKSSYSCAIMQEIKKFKTITHS